MANKSKSEDQPSLDDLITLPEAAELCELSYSHLRLLIRTGKIWGKLLGGRWLTTENAILEYLETDRKPGPKKD